MNFFFSFFLMVMLAVNALAQAPSGSLKPVPVVVARSQLPSEPVSSPSSLKLETLARQVLLIDFTTGVVLLEKKADELMAPSSMTKIMTAYIIFENLKKGNIQLDMTLPVSERAWRMGGSKMFVPLNGMVSIEDLLKGIIIQSGNDACTVVAEGLAGTEEAFAEVMTEKAHEMGALRTTFKNASGWPEPTHVTTARDLAIIAHRLITDFPEFYGMFGEKEFVYNRIRQWNRNPLLYKNIGCDGIKTGHTDSGGYGIVASVVQGERRLLLVVNGLPTDKARAQEVLKLMTWALQTFDNYSLFKPGDLVEKVPVWLGEDNFVEATVGEDAVMTLPKVSRKGLKVDILYEAPVKAPFKKGDVIGKIMITLPSQTLPVEVPLVAANSVGKAGFFKRIRNSFHYLIWGKVE